MARVTSQALNKNYEKQTDRYDADVTWRGRSGQVRSGVGNAYDEEGVEATVYKSANEAVKQKSTYEVLLLWNLWWKLHTHKKAHLQ